MFFALSLSLAACGTNELPPVAGKKHSAARVDCGGISGTNAPQITLTHTGWSGSQPVVTVSINYGSHYNWADNGYNTSHGQSMYCSQNCSGSNPVTFTITGNALAPGGCDFFEVEAFNVYPWHMGCYATRTASLTVCRPCTGCPEN